MAQSSTTPNDAVSLAQDPSLSSGRRHSGNLLIQADNLHALNLLRAQCLGGVRCVYIDPPYNNNERYNHYDDRLGHDEWLAAIETRLRILRDFLADDGSLWVSIDDSGVHYLKVLLDQIFGRANFIHTIVWEHRTTRENRRVFSNNHEYVLVYAKQAETFGARRNLVALPPEVLERYRNPDDDPRGPWQSVSANVQAGHATPSQFYELVAPDGSRHTPPNGRCWVYTHDRMQREIALNNVWFGRDGRGVPRLKRFLTESRAGVTPETLWTAEAVGTTRHAKRQMLDMFPGDLVFDTPKPEKLVARILEIATDPNDLVLDAYLGSGTTAAVAHKMGRRWIGIELGDHAVSLCAARLAKVVDGTDESGVTVDLGWKGGGGFDFLRVEPQNA